MSAPELNVESAVATARSTGPDLAPNAAPAPSRAEDAHHRKTGSDSSRTEGGDTENEAEKTENEWEKTESKPADRRSRGISFSTLEPKVSNSRPRGISFSDREPKVSESRARGISFKETNYVHHGGNKMLDDLRHENPGLEHRVEVRDLENGGVPGSAGGEETDKDTVEERDPNVVDFEGPDDPEKAVNWSRARKWQFVAVLSFMTFITYAVSFPGRERLKSRRELGGREGEMERVWMCSRVIANVCLIGHLHLRCLRLVCQMYFGNSRTRIRHLQRSWYRCTFLDTQPGKGSSNFSHSCLCLTENDRPIFIAPLSELYGRQVMYHITNILFVVFTVACALATNMSMLIGFRFMEGLMGSGVLTMGGGSLADLFVQEERGRAMAIWSSGPLLGPVIGPVAGGFLAEAIGWRWVFWIITIAVSLGIHIHPFPNAR